MRTIFKLRHMHTGVVHEHAFASPPTAEQVAPILDDLARRHGPGELITHLSLANDRPAGAPAWIAVVEATLYEAGEIPEIAPVGTAAARLPLFEATGTGSVI